MPAGGRVLSPVVPTVTGPVRRMRPDHRAIEPGPIPGRSATYDADDGGATARRSRMRTASMRFSRTDSTRIE